MTTTVGGSVFFLTIKIRRPDQRPRDLVEIAERRRKGGNGRRHTRKRAKELLKKSFTHTDATKRNRHRCDCVYKRHNRQNVRQSSGMFACGTQCLTSAIKACVVRNMRAGR